MNITEQSKIFESDKGDFHYYNWGGEGPLVHIAHATGLCAGAYAEMAAKLKPYMNVLGIDFRGHGRTVVPADPYRLKNWNIFYNDMERFLEHLGQPVIAIGHSLGGTETN